MTAEDLIRIRLFQAPAHPFNHQRIDELFKIRTVPQTFGYIKEVPGFDSEPDDDGVVFLSLSALLFVAVSGCRSTIASTCSKPVFHT